jgi:hypothetical protein
VPFTKGNTTGRLGARQAIPWETVCALRAAWARTLAAAGMTQVEWEERPRLSAQLLKDMGLPGVSALARQYGVSVPKASAILRGLAYLEPAPPGSHAASGKVKAARLAYRTARRARRPPAADGAGAS